MNPSQFFKAKVDTRTPLLFPLPPVLFSIAADGFAPVPAPSHPSPFLILRPLPTPQSLAPLPPQRRR